MPEEKSNREQPASPEAFGHPLIHEARHGSSDHKPGYAEPPRRARAPARAKKGKGTGAILPPRKAGKLPKTSIAERIRRRLSQKEQEP